MILAATFGGLTNPSHHQTGDGWACLRSSRHTDYSTINVAIGTPPRAFKLLLRLDQLLLSSETTVSIASDELFASATLRCDADTMLCSDRAIMEIDGRGNVVVLDSFQFRELDALESTLGIDGSFRMSSQTQYILTPTHFCFRDYETNTQDDVTNKSSPPSFYYSDSTSLLAYVVPTASSTTTLAFHSFECGEGDLFPSEASEERSWLALASQFLFESSYSTIEARREVVQKGLDCVTNRSTVAELYELDCSLSAYSTCRYRTSLPFRAVATSTVSIQTSNSTALVTFTQNDALENSLDNSDIGTGSLRFVLLLLIAFVVYSRSERKSSSAFFVFQHALNVLNSSEKHYNKAIGVVGDAVVGILAVFCRLVVIVTKGVNLRADGATDCIVSEAIGIVASSVHFLFRNFVLEYRGAHFEAPLTKLGGSMALADAGTAALISVASSPLAASAASFDSIARLFAATFLLVYVLHRLLFSSTACAVMASTTSSSDNFEFTYSIILAASCVLWMMQIASVSYALGRFFVGPASFSLLRSSTGEFTLTALLLLCVCGGINGLSVHRMLLKLKNGKQ